MWDRQRVHILAHDTVSDRASAGFPRQPSIFFDAHCFEARRHLHGVAIRAACGDNRTSRDGIPCGVGPLDLGFSHTALPNYILGDAASFRSTHGIDERDTCEVFFVACHHYTVHGASDGSDDHVKRTSRSSRSFPLSH